VHALGTRFERLFDGMDAVDSVHRNVQCK
jgi:hypothetical protein